MRWLERCWGSEVRGYTKIRHLPFHNLSPMPSHSRSVVSTLAICFFAIGASAQVSQGRYIVGVNGSAGISNSEFSGTTWSVSLSPNVLYLLTDQFAVGGAVGLSVFSGPDFSSIDDNDVILAYSFRPAARYYLSEAGTGGFFVFASAGVSGQSGFFSGNSFIYRTGIGYSLFFSKGLAVEPKLTLRGQTGNGNPSFNLGISIGLQGFVDRLWPSKSQASEG